MTCITSKFVSLLVASALVAGCAGTRPPTGKSGALPATLPADTPTADCRDLGAEIAKFENARRAAQEKERDAWKAVVPFAVVARKASGRADTEKAEKKLEKLRAEYTQQGCDRTGV